MLQTIDQFIIALAALAVAVIAIMYPEAANTWGNVIVNMAVPVLTILVGMIYVAIKGTTVNTEKKIELARANAAESQAKLQLVRGGVRSGGGAAGDGNSGYTYTIKDVEIVLNEAIADIESAQVKVDKLNTAEYDYTHMANYDLRPVAKEKRVALAKAFLEKNLALLDDAWIWYTNIQDVPTPEQAANKTTNMYYFKKEWEKANPEQACTNNIYSQMSMLLGYFNNVYSALAGVNSLVGVTVDYSTFGSGIYTPTSLGWEAANLVV